jgi:hypothetical protein
MQLAYLLPPCLKLPLAVHRFGPAPPVAKLLNFKV